MRYIYPQYPSLDAGAKLKSARDLFLKVTVGDHSGNDYTPAAKARAFRKYIKALGDYRRTIHAYNTKHPTEPLPLDQDLIRVPTPISSFLREKSITPPQEAKGLPLLAKVGEAIDFTQFSDQKELPPEVVIGLCGQEAYQYCRDLFITNIWDGKAFHPDSVLGAVEIAEILMLNSGLFPEGADVAEPLRAAFITMALKDSRQWFAVKLAEVFPVVEVVRPPQAVVPGAAPPRPDQHPDYENPRIREQHLQIPNTPAKIQALNNALAGLGGLSSVNGDPRVTLGQLQEKLAELGPESKEVGDFFRTAGITQGQIAALKPTMKSQNLLMDGARKINNHADKFNPDRKAGTGDSKEAKDALDVVRNASVYNRRVNELHTEDKDAYKTAYSTVAGVAAAGAALDDKFDPSASLVFSISTLLAELEIGPNVVNTLPAFFRHDLTNQIALHCAEHGQITEAKIEAIMQGHPLWSGLFGGMPQLVAAEKNMLRDALPALARAANADSLMNKINKPVVEASRKDDKLAEGVAFRSQTGAWLGLIRAEAKLDQNNGLSELPAALGICSFAAASNILAIPTVDFTVANLNPAGAGGARANALRDAISARLNIPELPNFGMANRRVNTARRARDAAHAALTVMGGLNGDQKRDGAVKIIVAGAAAIAGNTYAILRSLNVAQASSQQFSERISAYYVAHSDEPMTVEAIGREIEAFIAAGPIVPPDNLRLRQSVELLSKGFRTALATVEGVKIKNEQRSVARNEAINALVNPGGFSQGFAGVIADRIAQAGLAGALTEVGVRTHITDAVNHGNTAINAIFQFVDPTQLANLGLGGGGADAARFITTIRDELIRRYLANGNLNPAEITAFIDQSYNAILQPRPFNLPAMGTLIIGGAGGAAEMAQRILHQIPLFAAGMVQPVIPLGRPCFNLPLPAGLSGAAQRILSSYTNINRDRTIASAKAAGLKAGLSQAQVDAVAAEMKKQIDDGQTPDDALIAALKTLPKSDDYTAIISMTSVVTDGDHGYLQSAYKHTAPPLIRAKASAIGSAVVATMTGHGQGVWFADELAGRVVNRYLDNNNLPTRAGIDRDINEQLRMPVAIYNHCTAANLGFPLLGALPLPLIEETRQLIVSSYLKNGVMNGNIAHGILRDVLTKYNRENPGATIPIPPPPLAAFDALPGPAAPPLSRNICDQIFPVKIRDQVYRSTYQTYINVHCLKLINDVNTKHQAQEQKAPNFREIAAAVFVAGICHGLTADQATKLAMRITDYYVNHQGSLTGMDIATLAATMPAVLLNANQRYKLSQAVEAAANIPSSADAVAAGTMLSAKIFPLFNNPAGQAAMAAMVAKARKGSNAAMGTAAVYAEGMSQKVDNRSAHFRLGTVGAVLVSHLMYGKTPVDFNGANFNPLTPHANFIESRVRNLITNLEANMNYNALNALPARTPAQQAVLDLATEAGADIKLAVLQSAHTLQIPLNAAVATQDAAMNQLRKVASVATEVYINARKLGLTRDQAKQLIADMTDFKAIQGLTHHDPNPAGGLPIHAPRTTNSFDDRSSLKGIAQASLAYERATISIRRLGRVLRFVTHGVDGGGNPAGAVVIRRADLIQALTAGEGHRDFKPDRRFERYNNVGGAVVAVLTNDWVPVAVSEADVKSRADEAFELAKNDYINTLRTRGDAITPAVNLTAEMIGEQARIAVYSKALKERQFKSSSDKEAVAEYANASADVIASKVDKFKKEQKALATPLVQVALDGVVIPQETGDGIIQKLAQSGRAAILTQQAVQKAFTAPANATPLSRATAAIEAIAQAEGINDYQPIIDVVQDALLRGVPLAEIGAMAAKALSVSDETAQALVSAVTHCIDNNANPAQGLLRKARNIMSASSSIVIGEDCDLPNGAADRRGADAFSDEEYKKKLRAFQATLGAMNEAQGPPPPDTKGFSAAIQKYSLDVTTTLDAKNAGDWQVVIGSFNPEDGQPKAMKDIPSLASFVSRLEACDGFVTAETLRMAIDTFNEQHRGWLSSGDRIPKNAITVNSDGSIEVNLKDLSEKEVKELVELWTQASEFAKMQSQRMSAPTVSTATAATI